MDTFTSIVIVFSILVLPVLDFIFGMYAQYSLKWSIFKINYYKTLVAFIVTVILIGILSFSDIDVSWTNMSKGVVIFILVVLSFIGAIMLIIDYGAYKLLGKNNNNTTINKKNIK